MAGIVTAISIVAGALLALAFGDLASWLFGGGQYALAGPVLLFVAGYMGVNAALASMLSVLQLAGGGLWTASPVRFLVGKGMGLLLLVPAVWIMGHILPLIGLNWNSFLWLVLPIKAFAPPPGAAMPWQDFRDQLSGVRFGWLVWFGAVLAVILLLYKAIIKLIAWEKLLAAYMTWPLRQLWRSVRQGVGGSSSFNGLFDEWMMPWKPGQIILGTSLYEAGQRLGHSDDRHFITIATSRSGKGRSAVIPNLLTWKGSALVVDPKGENAAVTALARRKLGQDVHIVDPFGLLAQLGLDAKDYRSSRLNPLAEIRLDDLDVVEQIRNLAAALVMPSGQGNPFWDNAARQILAGILAHVLTWEKLNKSERHLGTVRDYVAQTNKRKMFDLRGNMAAGALADKAEALFRQSSDSAGGDIMTTLNVHMEWMDSVAMRNAMAASDFSFAALKGAESTVYLVIPPEYLDTHARYLRLFITLALRAAGKGRKAKHAMLFILDEFASLGELKVVADAAGQLAGMGVKLWPIIQNLTQLRQYGDNWEVFLANAGQQQVFAMNDQTTARYFSERLGHHISWRKVRSRDGRNRESFEWVPQSPTWLRTGPELARESSKDSGKALIFSEGGDVSLVRRGAYDRLFQPDEYAVNPYQPPRAWSRAGVFARLDKWERKGKRLEWAWQRRLFAKMDDPPSSSAEAPGDEGPPAESSTVVPLRPRPSHPPSQGLRRDEEREGAGKKPDA